MCRGWEQMPELALASAPSFPAEMWPVSAPGGCGQRRARPRAPPPHCPGRTSLIHTVTEVRVPRAPPSAPRTTSSRAPKILTPLQSLSSPRRACVWQSVSSPLWAAAPASLPPTLSGPRTLLFRWRKEPVARLSLRKSGEALEPQRRSPKRQKPLVCITVASKGRGASQEQESRKVCLSNPDPPLTANGLLGLLPGMFYQ